MRGKCECPRALRTVRELAKAARHSRSRGGVRRRGSGEKQQSDRAHHDVVGDLPQPCCVRASLAFAACSLASFDTFRAQISLVMQKESGMNVFVLCNGENCFLGELLLGMLAEHARVGPISYAEWKNTHAWYRRRVFHFLFRWP